MPITLPSNVAPNELIQSAWGNAVVDALDELDTEKADLAGATFTNNVLVDGAVIRPGNTGGNQVQIVDIDAGNAAYIGLYGNASSITTLNALTGLVGFASTTVLQIRNDLSGGDVWLRPQLGDVVFRPSDVETGRFSGTALLMGKAATDLSLAGIEMLSQGSSAEGSIRSTITAASVQNFYARHESSADADGEAFLQMLRGSTVIGQLLQHSTTGTQANLAGGFIAMLEVSDPGAATTNGARVFARDNGSGKTQLVVRFQSGAVQVLATEP